jgi:hypothetical protein
MYTAGLEPLIRDPRRAEIDSDLWEHAQSGRRNEVGARAVAGQILARCLLGVGADISWRADEALRSRRGKEVVPMKERIRQDLWLLAPMSIVLFGVVGVAAHITAGGFSSWWSDTDAGWDPSPLGRAGATLLVATLFVGMPLMAMAVRRSHPGWTLVLLLPSIVMSLGPLAWGEASWWLLMSLVGIAALVGAVVNLARHSVHQGLGARTSAGG